jgi:hypothetical protein
MPIHAHMETTLDMTRGGDESDRQDPTSQTLVYPENTMTYFGFYFIPPDPNHRISCHTYGDTKKNRQIRAFATGVRCGRRLAFMCCWQ